MTTDTLTSQLRKSNPKSSDTFDSNFALPKRDMAYRVWRTRVGTALLDYGGFDKEAFQFNACSEHPVSWIKSDTQTLPAAAATVWLCSHDATHNAALFMPTCDLRICPDCAARQSARFVSRFVPVAVALGTSGGAYKLRHMVFTTKISLTGNTPEHVQREVQRYSKLPRLALAKIETLGSSNGRDWKTLGAIQSFEFGSNGLLLHFHVIQYGAYVPQNLLAEAWRELTNDEAYVVHVNAIQNDDPEKLTHSIIEVLKYSVKFWKSRVEIEENGAKTIVHDYIEPNVMPHLLRVLQGVRRVRAWGVFYKLPKVKREPLLCEECHNEMLRFGTDLWQTWIESNAATLRTVYRIKQESFLHSKLANKSKKATLYESHSPPDESEKYRQKDLFKPQSMSHYMFEDNF